MVELLYLAMQIDAIPKTPQGAVQLARATPTILSALARIPACVEPANASQPAAKGPSELLSTLTRLDDISRKTQDELS
jgi:hypothetical protein